MEEGRRPRPEPNDERAASWSPGDVGCGSRREMPGWLRIVRALVGKSEGTDHPPREARELYSTSARRSSQVRPRQAGSSASAERPWISSAHSVRPRVWCGLECLQQGRRERIALFRWELKNFVEELLRTRVHGFRACPPTPRYSS